MKIYPQIHTKHTHIQPHIYLYIHETHERLPYEHSVQNGEDDDQSMDASVLLVVVDPLDSGGKKRLIHRKDSSVCNYMSSL